MPPQFTPTSLYEPTMVTDFRDPQVNNTNANKPQVDPQLKWLEPAIAPFVTLLANKKNQLPDVANPRHSWYKKYPLPNVVQNGPNTYTSADATIVLQAGDGVKIGVDFTLFNIRTEERIRVSAAPTGDSTPVVRNIGGSGGVGINPGDTFFILGPTKEDGSGIGPMKSTLVVEDFNYPEITRTPFGLTGRMLNTERWIGNDMEETQREAWHEHAKRLERKYFYGVRHFGTGVGGRGQNHMGGLADFVRTNVFDLNGNQLTQTSFNDFANEVFKYGGGGFIGGSAEPMKLMFGSRALFQHVTDWAGEFVRYGQTDGRVGMKIKEIQTAVGIIKLFPSAVFDTVPELRNQAFIVDINEIGAANYRGRATRLLSDRQAPDVDAREWEYFTDQTLEIAMEEAHGRILNMGF